MAKRSSPRDRGQALVVGGSLAGLFAGVALRTLGYAVEIAEASATPLSSRGAGIVMQPDVELLLRSFADTEPDEITTSCERRQYLRLDGRPDSSLGMPQRFTAWNALHRALAGAFPRERYRSGRRLSHVDLDGAHPCASFADGSTSLPDLLVCADGWDSTARRALLPEVRPRYAGYVAWRGLVPERELPAELVSIFADAFTFFEFSGGHILCYLVPGADGQLGVGDRRLNWVWYVNVPAGEQLDDLLTGADGQRREVSLPPGAAHQRHVHAMRMDAVAHLAEPFARLVGATREPFVQAIIDLESPRMAFGRTCLIGDAAFVPRPHTAASTSKAAADVLALAQQLHRHSDEAALEAWEPRQLSLGRQLAVHGQALGNRSQFATAGAAR